MLTHRGGRGREHRHLRTDQRGVARGQIRARGGLRRLREGLPHDRRRERRHGDHRARAVRRRDRRRQGVRAHAAVGTSISMVTAVFATRAMLGAARRLQLVRQPAVHGRGRRAAPQAGCRSTSSAGASSGSRSPAPWSWSASARSAIRGLNLGIDFEGGTQIAFTTPSPVALETVRDEAAKIGQAGARRCRAAAPRPAAASFREFQLRTETLTPPTSDAASRRAHGRTCRRRTSARRPCRRASARRSRRVAILAIIVSLLLIVALHHDALPVEVRGARDRRAGPRRHDHDRHLLADRPGGDDRRRSPRC